MLQGLHCAFAERTAARQVQPRSAAKSDRIFLMRMLNLYGIEITMLNDGVMGVVGTELL